MRFFCVWCLCVCKYIDTGVVYTCVHVRMCARVHICMCACAHVCMCACVHAYTFACVCVCICVCVCMSVGAFFLCVVCVRV